ncbi:MAG: putative transporter, partial [Modestobacter sp.]|nr:putative transporter [Modestobacter sp.]
MSLLSSRRRELPLADRLAALREAVEIAEDRLEVPEVGRARTLLAKAGAREALGDATVVALAGATGSGKSTLFNALSGAEVSTPGVRRPTTGVAHATVWGAEGADRLLDWLQVPRRHRVDRPDPALDGLVLLDLPDHDSVRLEHRLEVDRLVELVDVLVWVLDPQKYADAAVHDRYLAPLAGHAGVLVVVLNQVDRLDEPAARDCLTDLRRLLDAEGLAGTPLLATSARTGQGLAELRTELARRVAA